ncbi:hypothetical protein HanRHA438_Chr17g0806031 [Helianthus annuus]|nr:hypothetical protein HanRHA438_Chr17g0806031 [Helianthus annuus]
MKKNKMGWVGLVFQAGLAFYNCMIKRGIMVISYAVADLAFYSNGFLLVNSL